MLLFLQGLAETKTGFGQVEVRKAAISLVLVSMLIAQYMQCFQLQILSSQAISSSPIFTHSVIQLNL